MASATEPGTATRARLGALRLAVVLAPIMPGPLAAHVAIALG